MEAINSTFSLLVRVAVQLDVVFYDKYMGEMSISSQRGSRCAFPLPFRFKLARITVAFFYVVKNVMLPLIGRVKVEKEALDNLTIGGRGLRD